MIRPKATKPRKCKVCPSMFTPSRMGQKVCGALCALTFARSERAKDEKREAIRDRKETKAKLDAIRTKPQLVAIAQRAFNSFVRARDAGKTCISCPTQLPDTGVGGAFDCGHYRSVGSAVHMRFVEDNAHGQCKHCNRHLAGNHVAYRAGLIERIGTRGVELLESDQTLRKYSKEGLIEIARHYREQERKLRAA
jgi:hypothetical protein